MEFLFSFHSVVRLGEGLFTLFLFLFSFFTSWSALLWRVGWTLFYAHLWCGVVWLHMSVCVCDWHVLDISVLFGVHFR